MKNPRGVEIRPNSIRLVFAFDGRTERRTLMLNGKPMAPTPANIKYATRLVLEIKDRIRAGAFSMAAYFPDNGESSASRGTTVGDQLDHWLKLQTIAASTRKSYNVKVNFWKRVIVRGGDAPLGEKPLIGLKHSDILAGLKSNPKLVGKVFNNYLYTMRSALALAVKDKLLRENPSDGIDLASYQPEEPDPFDLDEAERIIAHVRKTYPASVANMVEFRFFSGLRTSEMAGLRWPSIDFKKKHMLVHEAFVLGEYKTTKTNRSRIVHLNTRAMAALKAQKEQTFLAGGIVFPDPETGAQWADEHKGAFRHGYWLPTLKKLGIRHRPPNHARHTYATMLLMSGATPAYAAKQMGHSLQVFLSTYAKWIDGDQNIVEQAKLESFIKSPALPEQKAENE